jgi:hypothetical protein
MMPCNKECNQGRNCNCDRGADRATVVICALVLIAVVAMGLGVYKLLNITGHDCAVEVQFKDGVKATYIGQSL